jgi:hypothetical protein
MTHELTDAGTLHLGVSLGTATRGAALTRILALRASPGWITGPGSEIREWRFEGLKEHEGRVFLVGPHVPGLSLQQALALPTGQALPLLARLARALLALSESGAGWFPLQSDSVIFTEDGKVLFLPPGMDRELRDLRTFEDNRETFECLNHPDLKGPAQAVFSIAAALCRILTGRFPFWGSDPNDLHEQVRRMEIQPPSRLLPGLEEDVSELVMAGLCRGRRGAPSLADFSAALTRWETHELIHPLSDERRQDVLTAAAARQAAAGRSFQRRRFWQRNWRVAAVVAVVAAVLGIVGGSVLKNVLAPRITRGYSPGKVVESFYAGMNTLDHMTMQACVVGGAGRAEIDETTTLYVTSRVTQGYEGHSNIISAAEWDSQRRPSLAPPQTLYGVTGVSLLQEQGEPSPVYTVTYEKWTPGTPPDTDSEKDTVPLPEGHSITDRVSMKKDRGDWVIFKIDRLGTRALPPPFTRPAG